MPVKEKIFKDFFGSYVNKSSNNPKQDKLSGTQNNFANIKTKSNYVDTRHLYTNYPKILEQTKVGSFTDRFLPLYLSNEKSYWHHTMSKNPVSSRVYK